MRYLILFLIASIAYAEEAKPKPLPLNTQAEIAKSERAIAGLKADYLKKANEEIQRLTCALQDQMKKMTQAGDLEGALVLRAKIAEVAKGDLITISSQGVEFLGKSFVPRAVTGKWSFHHGIVILYNPDNTMEMIAKGKIIDKGRWLVQDTRIVMNWDERGKKTWEYDIQNDTMKTDTQLVLNRINP